MTATTTEHLNITGNPEAEIIVIADAPAPGTYDAGKCIASHAGRVFLEAAKKSGFSETDFAFITPCPPLPETIGSSAKREKEFLDQYREELADALKTFSNAQTIVGLGNLACDMALGKRGKIMQMRGKVHENRNPATGLPVFAMLNPLQVLRRTEMQEIFQTDFDHFGSFCSSGYDSEASSRLTSEGDYKWCLDLEHVLENPPLTLAVDSETRNGWWYRGGRILTVQLSWGKGASLVIPLCPNYVSYWNSPERGEEALAKVRACGFPSALPLRKLARIKAQLRELLANPDVYVMGHNFKYDLHHLLNEDIEVANWWADTMQLAWTVDENMQNKSLDECVRRWIPEMAGYADKFNDTWDKEHMELVPPNELLLYAGGDTDACLRLGERLNELAREDERHWFVFEQVKMPAMRTFFKMERYGIIVDTAELTRFRTYLDGRLSELYDEMIKLVPGAVKRAHLDAGKELSFTRPDFITDALFSQQGLKLKPIIFTDTTAKLPNPEDRKPATSYEHLLRFADRVPLCKLLIDYSELQKMASTYVGLPAQPDQEKQLKRGGTKIIKGDPASGFWQYLGPENRIHPSFFLHRTTTGRTNSSQPNGQNIPKRGDLAKYYRKVFRPTPGYVLIEADLSQVELRLTAWAANERVMLDVYRRDGDIHTTTAAKTLGMSEAKFMELPEKERDKHRTNAKAGNFGLIYGMGWKGFREFAFNTYQVKFSESGAQDFRNAFFRGYPGLLPWHRAMKDFVGRHGYVRSLHGLLRRLPSIGSVEDGIKAEAERQAINSPIQGFASDLGIIAMTRFGRDCDWELMRPLMFVHDAVVIEAREDLRDEAAQALRWYMESPPLLEWFGLTPPLPIKADLGAGYNLAEIEKLKLPAVKPSWFTSDTLD
jgi:uracil-DNA glycosylase family 4